MKRTTTMKSSGSVLLLMVSFIGLISVSESFSAFQSSPRIVAPLTTQQGISSSSSPLWTTTTTTTPKSSTTRRNNSKRFSAAATTTPSTLTDSKKRLLTGLAFLTGWADVALVTKHKSFATMMTGNTMWMASAAFESRYKDVLYYLSLIVSYTIGVASFRRADISLKERSLSVCAPVATMLFVASDALSAAYPGTRWVPMILLSVAFGMVNSVGTEIGGTLAFVLTGHLTKLTNMVFDRFSRTAGRKKLTQKDLDGAKQSAIIIGGFFSGAVFAWGLIKQFPGFLKFGTFSTMGALFGLLLIWQDRKALGAWWDKEDGELCSIDSLETTCE